MEEETDPVVEKAIKQEAVAREPDHPVMALSAAAPRQGHLIHWTKPILQLYCWESSGISIQDTGPGTNWSSLYLRCLENRTTDCSKKARLGFSSEH